MFCSSTADFYGTENLLDSVINLTPNYHIIFYVVAYCIDQFSLLLLYSIVSLSLSKIVLLNLQGPVFFLIWLCLFLQRDSYNFDEMYSERCLSIGQFHDNVNQVNPKQTIIIITTVYFYKLQFYTVWLIIL